MNSLPQRLATQIHRRQTTNMDEPDIMAFDRFLLLYYLLIVYMCGYVPDYAEFSSVSWNCNGYFYELIHEE